MICVGIRTSGKGGPMDNKRAVGSHYEDLAAAFLTQEGMQIQDRNFRCGPGEIDIVARDGKYLVFVEVKYRGSPARGYPEEAVRPEKQRRIRKAATVYLYRKGYSDDTLCRFDVVSILGDRIRLIRDAF